LTFKDVLQQMTIADFMFEAKGVPRDAKVTIAGKPITSLEMVYNRLENTVEINMRSPSNLGKS
jgi:hypothetical protein